MRLAAVILASAAVLAACESGDGGDGGGLRPNGDQATLEIDRETVAAVNAEVPPGIDLRFERSEWDEEDFVYLRPVGWVPDEGADLTFTSDDLSPFTTYRVGKSCDGLCEPGKDWEARQDDLLAVVLDPDRYEVLEDRRLDEPDGRTVVARARRDSDELGDPEIRVVTIRWEQEAPMYFQCLAVLDGADAGALADAFTAACEAAVPQDFDAVSVSFGTSDD